MGRLCPPARILTIIDWPSRPISRGRRLWSCVISRARSDHTTSMPQAGVRRQLDANMVELARLGGGRSVLDALPRANALDHVLEGLADLPRFHGFTAALLRQLENVGRREVLI